MKAGFAIAMAALILGTVRPVPAAQQADDADQPAKVLAEQVCAVCHGPGGRSTDSATPNLAAQSRQYLAAKMRLFRHRSASKPETHIDILGFALMDDPMADALARYFANQPAALSVANDAAVVAAGSKIYTRGVPEQQLAPCGVCHGVNAAGLWIFPRLAGQHAEYVERQLVLIQERLRDAPVMHGVIKTMSPADIKAVAAFVQSK